MSHLKGAKRAAKIARRQSRKVRKERIQRSRRTAEYMAGLADDLATVVDPLPEAHKIVFLGYQGDRFIVVTQDGTEVKGVPTHWKGLPVEYREATPEERAAHRKWLEKRDDI
jgi:hypothetical protein